MHIKNFDSPEEMADYLLRARAQALDSLHSAQRDITYGDHWVRFADIANGIIEFGYVWKPEQIGAEELRSGSTISEMNDSLAHVEAMAEQGLMYGTAYSKAHSPAGEVGYTHKAHVWPIEEQLFDLAREAFWIIEDLDATGRVLLQIAFACNRAHVIGQSA